MNTGKIFSLSFLIMACLVAGASHAAPCADQADCLKSASAKVSQTLTPKVVPVFGDYPKLYIHDSAAEADYPVPDNTKQVFDFYTNKTSFNFPPGSSIETREIASISPATGFTILLVEKTRDNTTPNGGSALSLLSSNSNDAYLSFALGAKPSSSGQKWSVAKSFLEGRMARTAYWQKPWDMNLLGPTGDFSGTEWIYFTFTPDGKVRIDRFAPYTYFLAFTAYQWDEAVLDSGFPHFPFDAGTPTDRPNSVTFGTVGPWLIGAAGAPGQTPPTIEPIQALPGFEGATIFSAPLSMKEVIAYQNSLRGSDFLDENMLPCNSGQYLSGQISTPCGTASPGNPPPNMTSLTRW
ncbi:hypothetical protein QN219_32030 [Sinorhizobium sp. 7-81]|uniref:hypothetical protein n=1 Tax=unclassified Sinorhizobium TaxID=2613772 RepID=UPI0024C3CD5B|nr:MULTISPECIES: hypothetical protein [unclassified Sinorhizobium]MDK1389929.1 hypothetical protein [Sinorhizobium sp. 7-81]MDK1494553.1 hypothetical protein [Sinorhizobium sp. 8-89]